MAFKNVFDIFYSTELAVPLFQIILLLFFTTIALLFGKTKIALLINYIFTFYWGYLFNKDRLLGTFKDKSASYVFLYVYFGFAIVIVLLALIGFISSD